MNRDHCHYCNKPLYKLYQNQFLITTHIEPNELNSTGHKICMDCHERLIRKGTHIVCAKCDTPLYETVKDMFRGTKTTVKDFRGIPPQHDPIEGVYSKCRKCRNLVEWGV